MELAEEKIMLYEALKASRALQVYDSRDKNWQRSFKLHGKDTGQELDMGCPKCYGVVAQWLQK